MSLSRRGSSFGELLSLRDAMDRLFEDSYVRPRGSYAGLDEQTLPVDICMTEDALVVRAALPGLKPEDVEITLTGDLLTIAGEFREEHERKDEQYLFQELRRGRFSRSISLPADLDRDSATANFENGLLMLTIPKAEQTKPRQIRITTGAKGDVSNAQAVGPGRQDERAGSTEPSRAPTSGPGSAS